VVVEEIEPADELLVEGHVGDSTTALEDGLRLLWAMLDGILNFLELRFV
jgi:hypothetical protein